MKFAGRVLNSLYDDMDGGVSDGTKRDLKQLRSIMNTARYRGVKFIAPHATRVDPELPVLASDLRPPFPVTLIEFDVDNKALAGMIIAMDAGDRVRMFMAMRGGGGEIAQWFISPAIVFAEYSDEPAFDGGEIWHSTPYLQDKVNQLIAQQDGDVSRAAEFFLIGARQFIMVYTAMCQTLKYHHTETIDVEPDAKENRIRRVKRQTPLFTYKTLVIGERKPKVKTRKSSGTHASPRSHLRRGHYRTSKNGNRYWVSAAFVNGAPGFVHKDYKLEGAQ